MIQDNEIIYSKMHLEELLEIAGELNQEQQKELLEYVTYLLHEEA